MYNKAELFDDLLKEFHEYCAILLKERDEMIAQMSLREQLDYSFQNYGWEMIENYPPTEEEPVMYVKAIRIPGKSSYCVPELPKYQLVLIEVSCDVFSFAVDLINKC